MIKKLTPEQQEYLPVFRQKYLDMACNGSRIDREKLEPAIEKAYAVIGKEKPLVIILQSPLQAMMGIKFMKHFAKEETGDQLWGQLRGQLWDQLRGQLRDQLWDQLGDQLWGQLRDQLGDQLRGQLRDQLGGQDIYDSNYLWGSQDLYWICFVRFAEHIGAKLKTETQKRLTIMEEISSQCEWWWPCEGICFVSEKPTQIKWDDEVLHSETGPAVTYEDGFSLYSWRGVRVPKEWIEDKSSITPEIALTWKNVEQRRCAAEIVGWHNVLAHPSLKPEIIDTDNDPQIGQLVSVDLPDIGRENFLFVECGTGRKFALPVPPNMKTALEANSWTWGLEPEQYMPELRT